MFNRIQNMNTAVEQIQLNTDRLAELVNTPELINQLQNAVTKLQNSIADIILTLEEVFVTDAFVTIQPWTGVSTEYLMTYVTNKNINFNVGAHIFFVGDQIDSVISLITDTTFKVSTTYSSRTGYTGPTGATPNISVGTVTTVAPDQPAQVELAGGSTPENPSFNFWIPQGIQGISGVNNQGLWTPRSYNVGDLVQTLGINIPGQGVLSGNAYIANQTTVPEDIPGASLVWTVFVAQGAQGLAGPPGLPGRYANMWRIPVNTTSTLGSIMGTNPQRQILGRIIIEPTIMLGLPPVTSLRITVRDVPNSGVIRSTIINTNTAGGFVADFTYGTSGPNGVFCVSIPTDQGLISGTGFIVLASDDLRQIVIEAAPGFGRLLIW